MLVLCNGPFKSGSTWLYEIARLLVEPETLPREYADPVWLPVESVPARRLSAFVTQTDVHGHDYVLKLHESRPRRIGHAIDSDDVVVLGIRRDLRDVVVSSFHHYRALGHAPEDFGRFYWSHGRYLAAGVVNHHRRWSDRTDLTLEYEALLDDFEGQAAALASLLGREASAEQLRSIKDRVGLADLRERYASSGISGMQSSQFFRSGTSGGWSDYLDAAMLDDLARIERSGLSLPARVRWYLVSRFLGLRRRLSSGS